jgi:hypothetical protein
VFLMLKIAALLACIIGVIFVGPKAVAEFRRARPIKGGSHPVANPDDSKDHRTSKRVA